MSQSLILCLVGTGFVSGRCIYLKKTKFASVEILNKKFFIPAVMNFIDGLALQHTSMDYSRYNRLRFVVSELLKRRVLGAYPGTDGKITVDVYVADTYIEISIQDKGVPMWMEISPVGDFVNVTDEKNLYNYMIEFMTDGFGLEKLGKDGQRIYVRMNLLNKIGFKEPEPYQSIEVLDTNISIKEVKTHEDAIEAIRCIYSEYKYSYSYERFYYIESFMRAIKEKEIMSFLAVNEHGQTAGHFALVFSPDLKNMPEISAVVTRKEFRGLGLFAKFMDYAIKFGEKNSFRALMGQPVAFHTLSQKAFIKSGFTATAVLLSYIGSDIESEYNKNKERLDLFASVKILDESAGCVVYIPKEIKEFTQKVFEKMNYNYTVAENASIGDATEINIETYSTLKTTKILVKSAAEDLEEILKDAIKDSIRGKNEMIELAVSMNAPSSEYAYEVAKKCGFVFSGLLPGSETADYFIMQMMIGTDCNYDRLVVTGEYEDLKNEILLING